MDSGVCWLFPVNENLKSDSLRFTKHCFLGAMVPVEEQYSVSSPTERITRRFLDDYIWISFIVR